MSVLPGLHPLFQALLANGSSASDVPVSEARAHAHLAMEQYITRFYAPIEPLAREADIVVPVSDGSITVRVYSTHHVGSPMPCHVYFHGGGFWLGTLDHFDALCRATARDAQCIVVSVAYRHAPEHKFPVPTEDAYAALLWVRRNAGELGIDVGRLSVGGVSAGGNLAAVVALMARDRGGPDLKLQVLEVPITDLYRRDALILPDEDLELPSGKDTYCRHYLSSEAEALLPYVSPLLATNLRNLPPALIMCAEYDPLAREGLAYAERLADAGVSVEYVCWSGQFHGAQPMTALIPDEAAAYQARLATALRRAYAISA